MEPNEILEQAIRELTETALQNRREAADAAEKELLSEEVDLSMKASYRNCRVRSAIQSTATSKQKNWLQTMIANTYTFRGQKIV